MLLCPERYSSKLCFVLLISVFLLVSTTQAQSKKPVKGKQTASKTVEKTAKDAKKDSKSKKETASAKSKSDSKSKSNQAELNKKDAKSAKSNDKNSKKAREEAARLAEARRVEEAKRRAAEEARRQAILAEKRRREQIAREARARALAFERGLRTTTVENISNDITEGEDLQIRRAAINALGNHAGTVVVMEAQTGKVLTIVNQDWAIRNSYRPCSTIKLVTGVAGLNENVINQDGMVGNFRMNLDDALAFSNNLYFQKVGVNIGNSRVIEYARALGLGEPTGINDQGEVGGKLPYNNSNARIYSHGDDFEVSPLQLAVLVSAISNGGKIVVPQVPRSRVEQANFRGYLRRQVNLPMNKVMGVIPGMIGAAEYGTAHRGVDHTLGIAGKTGSCIGKGSWLGLFASVAPIQNPKYAVVVITRGQSERGKYAAAVAGQVYNALSPRLLENGNKNLALIPYNLKPKTQINLKTAAKIEEEDEDEDTTAEEAEADAEKEKIIVKQTPPRTPEKKQQNTENSFPPVVIEVKKSNGEFTRPRIVNNK
ncbi:MAG: hypothetical protein LUM44_21495 [Pyrinomonadaceae bacterium]|nr:hypothetical protein [Pyrinomonadaceae bacterium]